MATRTDPRLRKQQILAAALDVARSSSLYGVTRKDVAARAGCSAPLVGFYFASIEALRDAVVAEALKTQDLSVIAQCVVMNHPRMRRINKELKARALATLTA